MNEQKQKKKNNKPKASAAACKTNSFPFAVDTETGAFVIRKYDIKSFVPCDMKKHGLNFLDDEFLCPLCCDGEFCAYDISLFRKLMKHIEGGRENHSVDDYIKGVQNKVAMWCKKIAPIDRACRESKWSAGKREGISRGVRMMGAKVLQWALEIPKAFQYSQYPDVENISILNLDDFRDGASTIQGVMAGEGHCTQWGLHDFMVATLANFCAFLKGCAGQFLPCAKTVGSIIRDIEAFQGAFASTQIELKRALQIRKDIIEKLKVLSDEIFEYECSAPQEPSRAKPPQDKIAQELLNFGMEMGKRHPEMKNPEIIRWICNKENGKLAWAARIILDNAKAGEDVMIKAQVQRNWEKLVLERTFKKKIRKWAQYLSQHKNGKGRTEKRE